MERIKEIIDKLIARLTKTKEVVQAKEDRLEEAKQNLKVNAQKVEDRKFCYTELLSIVGIAIAFTYLAFLIFA